MSANIAVINGIAGYIGRQSAWHKLGKVTGSYLTWLEILAHGALDFDVFKSQLNDGRGNKVEAYATFRWNREDKNAGDASKAVFLGTVGKDYRVIQHRHGFEMIDALVQSATGGHYETAGVLGNGETVFGTADLGLSVNVGDDKSKAYLAFATSHDGSLAFQLWTCLERIVCANTLRIALSQKTAANFRVKHTKNADGRVQDIKSILASLQGDMLSVEDKMKFLAERELNREAVVSILDRLFPKTVKGDTSDVSSSTRRENILSQVLENFEYNDGDTFPEQRGTPYALLNAITAYADHQRSSKGDNRAESALFGSGDALKSKALEYITVASQTLPVRSQRMTFATPATMYSTPVTVSTGSSSSLLDDVLNATVAQ